MLLLMVVVMQVSHFEETIKQLQEDFLESQAQHSTCYNEVPGVL